MWDDQFFNVILFFMVDFYQKYIYQNVIKI